MADPVTIALAAGAIGGSVLGSMGKSNSASIITPASSALPPDPSTPATLPGQKPAQKSQQQSFLSGAANLQGGAAGMNTGSSGGKSLLGQ